MKVFLKASACVLASAVFLLVGDISAEASTGLYVGKDVSGDGTTLLGLSFEHEVGVSAHPQILEKGALKKSEKISSSNGFEYTLPEDSAKMTVVKTMSYSEYGGWEMCAMNEYGVSVISYVSTAANADALKADPYVEDGISEETIPQILAANSKSAADAAKLLCSIYDESGAECAEIVMIGGKDGAWAVENFTGHQYVATKLPDDKIGVYSHEPMIKTADPKDPDTICSSKLFSLPKENGFAVYDENKDLDLILTYNEGNEYSDESHLRVWVGHDVFAASEELDYDAGESYDVFFTPDEDVTADRAFDFFRNRYEGTPYDLNDPDNTENYWGINNQAVSCAAVFQIFPDAPAEISTVLWVTPANPAASPFIPIPEYADSIPACFAKDVTDDSYADGTLQYDFIRLNNLAVYRRNEYGRSIREYWEGMEAVNIKDVRKSLEGAWKEALDVSADEAAKQMNDYLYTLVVSAQENCDRITDELNWFMFRNGIHRMSESYNDEPVFECSFDAVGYAYENGWTTTLDGDKFTAEKDGKTIEIILSGEHEGDVTFRGFDNRKLMEDFFGEDITAESDDAADDDAVPAQETEEEAEEKIQEALEEAKEDKDAVPSEDKAAADEAADSKKAEEPDSAAKDEAAVPTEDAKSAADVTESAADVTESASDKAAKAATARIEVDTIAELNDYFGEKIAAIPRDGWAEGEIAGELQKIAGGVAGIINRHFKAKDIDQLIKTDYAKVGEDILSDPDITKIGDQLAEAGTELSALAERYFTSLAVDVTDDVVSGRLSQEGAVRILNEAQTEIVGITRLYLEGVEGAFSEVFNTDLSEEEYEELLKELDGVVDVLDDYGIVDQESLGLDKFDLADLSKADVDVVITLNEMDDDVIDQLSDMLGVDVRSKLDEYMDAFASAGITQDVKEEKHENEKANSELEEGTLTGIEKELTEGDIDIPQEVIDILNEAIAEAQSGAGDAGDNGEFTVSLGKLEKSEGRVLLPTRMLKYFN